MSPHEPADEPLPIRAAGESLADLENEAMLLSLIIAWLVLSCVVVPIWLSNYRWSKHQ